MNKALAAWMVSMFVTASAFAQQPGSLPPEQAPAGDPGKFQFKKPATPKADDASSKMASPKPVTKAERRAARKEARAEKVGPKPID